MLGGKLIEKEHHSQHYRVVFNQQTGFFVRKEDVGWPEPKWAADGPELIDLSITNYCERGCAFCYRETKQDEAVNVALKALAKQIPKKPTGEHYARMRCPSCNHRIPSGQGSSSRRRDNWCNYCGQKIDWSEG